MFHVLDSHREQVVQQMARVLSSLKGWVGTEMGTPGHRATEGWSPEVALLVMFSRSPT